MKKYFESIIWPKKERVKKEFAIVAVGTVVIATISFGINTFAQFLLGIIF